MIDISIAMYDYVCIIITCCDSYKTNTNYEFGFGNCVQTYVPAKVPTRTCANAW